MSPRPAFYPRRLQAKGAAAGRFHALLCVLSSLGPGATQGRSQRDLQRSMSQLITLGAEAPPALLTDASLDLLARVTAAAVSWGSSVRPPQPARVSRCSPSLCRAWLGQPPLPSFPVQLRDEHSPEVCKLVMSGLQLAYHKPHLWAAALASGAVGAMLQVPGSAPVAQHEQVRAGVLLGMHAPGCECAPGVRWQHNG